MCYNTLRRGKTSVAYPQNFPLSRKRDCLPLGEKGGVTLKQIWSKSLACLLCLALLAGMLPVAALAAQDTHQPETYAGPTELDWQGAGTEKTPPT